MVLQERPPGFGRRLGVTTRHQVGNRGFGDLYSQLEQFAVNPGSAPKRIDFFHPANKIADFGTDLRPPRALSRQNSLKPFLYYRTAVPGLKTIKASRQLDANHFTGHAYRQFGASANVNLCNRGGILPVAQIPELELLCKNPNLFFRYLRFPIYKGLSAIYK